MPHPVIENAPDGFGAIPRVQLVAVEAKPVPVTPTTVPLVPVVGEITICGRTVKLADTPTGISFPGVPFTATFQFFSEVAREPTTKLPVATPALIEQLKEPISKLSGVTPF